MTHVPGKSHRQTLYCTSLPVRLIASLGVKHQVLGILTGIATTEIHLDEIKLQFVKVHLAVLVFVVQQTDAYATCLAAIERSTCVVTGITVDASFQSQLVHVLYNGFQTIGETHIVDDESACLPVSVLLEAIVNVDVLVTAGVKSRPDHGVSLTFDD